VKFGLNSEYSNDSQFQAKTRRLPPFRVDLGYKAYAEVISRVNVSRGGGVYKRTEPMTKCLSFSFCSCILEVVSYLVSLFKSFLCVSCLSVLVYLYLCVEVEVYWRLIKSVERKESRKI
jgi:hypothetical protein